MDTKQAGKKNVASRLDVSTRMVIADTAWGCTVGAGNDSETVDYESLKERLRKEPTDDEKRFFKQEWQRCLQEMAQP